jgi:hypothetical protein
MRPLSAREEEVIQLYVNAGWERWRDEAPARLQPSPLFSYSDLLPWYDWTIIGLGFLLAFVFLGAHFELRRLDKQIAYRSRPHLVFTRPYVDWRIIGALVSSFNPAISMFQPKTDNGGTTRYKFGHVSVANSPEGVDYPVKDVEKAVAHLTYRHDGDPIRLRGRWGKDKPQVAQLKPGESLSDLASIDFPANGLPRELDLVFQPDRSKSIYAYSDDSSLLSDWKDKRLKLIGDDVSVELKIVGAGEVLAQWRFLIKRAGGLKVEYDPDHASTLAAYTGES